MRSWSRSGAGLAVGILGALLTAPGARAAVFDCDETGVQTAVGTGGGPHSFSCAGPTTVVLSGTLVASTNVVLDGEGLLTLSGGDSFQVLSVGFGATVELRRLAITEGNSFGGTGGCIYVGSGTSLTLTQVTVTGCTVGTGAQNYGGAIYSDSALSLVDSLVSGNIGSVGSIASGIGAASASLSLTRTTVSANTIGFVFGGIYVYSGNVALTDSVVEGNEVGGLLIAGVTPGTRTISGSTISGNTAVPSSGTTGFGVSVSLGSISITNSTIAHNEGPGIRNNGSSLTVTNSTIAGNGNPLASAIFRDGGGSETLRNTVFAGTCTFAPRTSQGGNLESPGNTCGLTHASDQVNVSAAALHLGALGNYGGPTQTVPLLPNSVAIGAAVSCPPPGEDQRSVLRPQGASCDAGAFEFVLEVPALPWTGLMSLLAALAAIGALALRRCERRSLHSRS